MAKAINKEAVKEWVDALRSGNYSQAKERLKNDQSFCCLGVACDLFKDRVGGQWNGNVFVANGVPNSFVLPREIADLLGLDDLRPEVICGDFGLEFEEVTSLNDSGKSFSEIADLLESTYLRPSAEGK